jgi:hypothetical protein
MTPPMLLNPNLAAPPSLTFQQEVLADGPVRFYRTAESSGTSATDISGNAQHGTYVGTPTLNQAGPRDKSVLFGSGAYLAIPTTGLGAGNTSYTLAAFVKVAYGQNHGIWGIGTVSDNQANCVTMNASNNIKNWWFSNDVQTGNDVVANGAWAHLALVYNGLNRIFIVNGIAISTQGSSGKNTVYGSASFGRDLNAVTLNGSAAELAIFNTAVSTARIAAWLAAPA